MWQVEMVILLRHMIGDINEPYVYTDNRLQELILVSSQFVNTEVGGFQQKYQVNVQQLLLKPDPTMSDTRNDSFINLSVLKSACIIDNCVARLAANKSMLLRDADKSVDLRDVGTNIVAIWKAGWCKNYTDAKFEYMAGNMGMAGAAVIGPFRVWSNYNVGPWNIDGAYVGNYDRGAYRY
jgi:hypothetical protein